MKVKKHTLESFIFFLLSPVITILFQIFFIIRGSRFALNMLIFSLGLVGYIFVPSFTNDKTRYYERYEILKDLDFGGYVSYLIVQARPDFIFESLNFLFATSNLNIQILFFLINTFSIYTIFRITDLITNYFSYNKYRKVCFFLILFSFALQHLYSGIRFTFATCIFLWAIYYWQYKKELHKSIILILITVFTHFSMALPIGIFICYKLFPHFNYKSIYIISFVFLIVPKELLSQLFNLFQINEGYSTKVDLYVNQDDFITQNFENNVSSVIVYYIRNAWIFLGYIMLFFTKREKNNHILQILFLFFAMVNVFYAFPTIYSRYLILVKFIFTIFLILRHLRIGNNKLTYIYLFLYFLTTVVDIYVIRPNFIATLYDNSIFTLITILLREVGLEQIIDNRI